MERVITGGVSSFLLESLPRVHISQNKQCWQVHAHRNLVSFHVTDLFCGSASLRKAAACAGGEGSGAGAASGGSARKLGRRGGWVELPTPQSDDETMQEVSHEWIDVCLCACAGVSL